MRKELYHSVFFIGIGGSGMSSLAHILLDKNIRVAGYDKNDSASVRDLVNRGVAIYKSIDEVDTKDYAAAVYSSAIGKNHPVYDLFFKQGTKLLHRSQLLHEIFAIGRSISVAGSHGKTTTTTMLAQIFTESAIDPTVMVGAGVSFFSGRGGRAGKGEWGIYESDESDGTFLNHSADIKIVTNIDSDHLDYYKNTHTLYQAFLQHLTTGSGRAIVYSADEGIRNMLQMGYNNQEITGYTDTESQPDNYRFQIQNDTLQFYLHNKQYSLQLPLPGDHYLRNAMAAIIAASLSGIAVENSIAILKNFKGPSRRMELLGEYHGCKIYDDYGHHPTEIFYVIQTAKKLAGSIDDIVFIFQPHRYSRTAELYREFAEVFSSVPFLFLLPVYSAGEEAIEGIDSGLIAAQLDSVSLLSGNRQQDTQQVQKAIQDKKLLVCIGAGDVRKWGEEIINL